MDLKIWILLALATQSFAAVFSVEEINTENYLLTGARFDELISEHSGPPPSTKEQTTTTNYAESQSAASDSSLFDERVQVLEERLKRVTLLQMKMNKEIFEMRRRMLGRSDRPTFPRICGTGIIGNDDVSSEEDIIYTRSLTPQSDSKYYVLSTKKLIWEQALLFCKEKGMQLASIETEAENKALYKLIGETKRTFWASGTDLGSEGTFYWNGTGSKVEGFTNFDKGEPNNFNGTEHCLELVAHDGAIYWNDNNCNISFDFICEKSLEFSDDIYD